VQVALRVGDGDDVVAAPLEFRLTPFQLEESVNAPWTSGLPLEEGHEGRRRPSASEAPSTARQIEAERRLTSTPLTVFAGESLNSSSLSAVPGKAAGRTCPHTVQTRSR
jgi:hypothetical protein